LVVVTRGRIDDSETTRSHIRQVSPGSTVTIVTDPANNQAAGTIRLPHLGRSTATLQLGGVNGMGATNSTYTDNQNYAMVTQTNDPTRISTFKTGHNTVPLPNTTALATNSLVSSVTSIPMHGTPGACTCEYLSWGWWATNFRDPNHQNKSYTALGNYVVGSLTPGTSTTPNVQMPQTGTASYAGGMAGVVNNQGSVYAAGGNFSMDYNYGTRRGVTNMTFDNSTYRGNVQGTGTYGTNHAGSFAGTNGTGVMNGSFYGPGGANVGGNFNISGRNPAYQASGIYTGQK
jgi:hypothetical protein